MLNVWKPRGVAKALKPDSGGAVAKTVPMLGIVKDNIDPIRAGRIRVFISELGGKDPDDEKNWTPVLYMSTFFGATDSTGGQKDFGSFKANPTSYGVWNSPPDIGSIVVCMFINGDPNFGFYIGCIPDADTLRMVPAIGANFENEKVIFNEGEAKSYGGATRVPVTNMNNNNADQTNSSAFLDTPKPAHSYQAYIMAQQGILRDPIRGPISSSAQRESPSRVGWGVSTPGRPIYEGGHTDETIAQAAAQNVPKGLKVVGRRGGHTFVMDDGDLIGQDNLVRIRTSLGHQIMMSDSGQTLMILHSNGQSYIELGKEGTIDLYSTNSVNIRTQGDLNLHADRDINLNAGRNLNMQAESINSNAEKSISQKAGADYKVDTKGTHTHKVGGAMSMSSNGDASYASSAVTFVNGSKINLNTGSTGTVPNEVPAIAVNAHTDTLYDSDKGFAAAPGKLLSIVSRAPAHAPWANAGQGIDVKVDLGAKSQLPPAPSAAVATTNNAVAAQAPAASVTPAVAATVPNVNAASSAIDKNTTAAMVGAVATQAATAAAAGTAAAGAIGACALTPQQIEAACVIKPGAAAVVQAGLDAGKTLQQAMPNNLFTGVPGAQSLEALQTNVTAQANVLATNFQQAQTALTNAGAITGKEAGSAIAGPVLAAATVGVNPTLDAIKNIGTTVSGAVTNMVSSAFAPLSGAASAVTKAMGAGNFAANMAQNVTGGLNSISTALNLKGKIEGLSGALDSAKGIAASAFASVTNSFKPFKAGIPQDLTKIAADNKAAAAAADAADAVTGKGLDIAGAANKFASNIGSSLSQNVTGLASGALGSVTGALGSASSALGSATNLAGNLTSNLPKLGGGDIAGAASTLASGLGSLPGGADAASAVVSSISGATQIPGTDAVKSLINNSVTAATNGISLPSSVSGLASVSGAGLDPSKLANTLGGDIGKLASDATGAMDKLKSGASSLTALASSGLGAGAATKLNAQLAALGSGGSFEIKLPTVATGTTNREELTAKAASVLGSGIPTPNFGEPSEAAKAALEKLRTAAASAQVEQNGQQQSIDGLKSQLQTLTANLPAGDPEISNVENKLKDEIKKQAALASITVT